MARYIDADLLINNIAKVEDLRTLSTKTIGEAISNTPTADVVEVKHGKWIMFGLRNPQCSLCHKYNYEQSDYCPNCGARMDGGKGK